MRTVLRLQQLLPSFAYYTQKTVRLLSLHLSTDSTSQISALFTISKYLQTFPAIMACRWRACANGPASNTHALLATWPCRVHGSLEVVRMRTRPCTCLNHIRMHQPSLDAGPGSQHTQTDSTNKHFIMSALFLSPKLGHIFHYLQTIINLNIYVSWPVFIS